METDANLIRKTSLRSNTSGCEQVDQSAISTTNPSLATEDSDVNGENNESGEKEATARSTVDKVAEPTSETANTKLNSTNNEDSDTDSDPYLMTERAKYEDLALRLGSGRSRKRFQSNIRYLAETEVRLSTIEDRLRIGHELNEHKHESKHEKAAMNHTRISRSSQGYHEYSTKYDWVDIDKEFNDDPDPTLTWAQLISFYSEDLESKVSEVPWEDFCQDDPTCDCIVETPSETWTDWDRRKNTARHRFKRAASHDSELERRTYDICDTTSIATGKQAVRINSKVALSILRQITQEPIPKGILLAPYREFWFLEGAINDTLGLIRTAAQSDEANLSLIPFHAQEPGVVRVTSDAEKQHRVQSRDSSVSQIQDLPHDETSKATACHDEEKNIFSKSEEFEKIKAKAKNTAMLHQLEPVVQYMNAQIADEKTEFERLKARDAPKIKYENLWKFYAPGTVVLSREDDNRQALCVLQATGGRPVINPEWASKESRYRSHSEEEKDTGNPFIGEQLSLDFTNLIVDCYYLCFNGRKRKFEPVAKRFEIERFYGEQEISSLVVFPREHAKVGPNQRKNMERDQSISRSGDLVQRGKVYHGLVSNSKSANKAPHRMYDGLTLDDPAEEVDCPVIVDMVRAAEALKDKMPEFGLKPSSLAISDPRERAYFQAMESTCNVKGCKSCVEPRKRFLGGDDDDQCIARAYAKTYGLPEHWAGLAKGEFEDKDYELLPYKVYGFVLRRRKWAVLDIDKVTSLKQKRDEAFKDLELPDGHQSLVARLVKSHLEAKRNPKQAPTSLSRELDPIEGKGKGLIILLHGEPGVGKTSTAEASAQAFDLPLYPITCGNLGDKPDVIEDQLQLIFQEAHRWNCVLLLDEADIFLTKRSKTELERNALVSVFLRQLEYYGGILFLTTHRVGVLDDAFRSRIRLSLYYPPLNANQTRSIFEKHLNFIESRLKGVNAIVDRKGIMDFQYNRYRELEDEQRDYGRPFEGWWNGRQIRNAFQTVIALASYDKNCLKTKVFNLSAEHFRTVAKTSNDFNRYMTDTNGGLTEVGRAVQQHERTIKVPKKRGQTQPIWRDASTLRSSGYPQYGTESRANWNYAGDPIDDENEDDGDDNYDERAEELAVHSPPSRHSAFESRAGLRSVSHELTADAISSSLGTPTRSSRAKAGSRSTTPAPRGTARIPGF